MKVRAAPPLTGLTGVTVIRGRGDQRPRVQRRDHAVGVRVPDPERPVPPDRLAVEASEVARRPVGELERGDARADRDRRGLVERGVAEVLAVAADAGEERDDRAVGTARSG